MSRLCKLVSRPLNNFSIRFAANLQKTSHFHSSSISHWVHYNRPEGPQITSETSEKDQNDSPSQAAQFIISEINKSEHIRKNPFRVNPAVPSLPTPFASFRSPPLSKWALVKKFSLQLPGLLVITNFWSFGLTYIGLSSGFLDTAVFGVSQSEALQMV
jgi:hypothetical protein